MLINCRQEDLDQVIKSAREYSPALKGKSLTSRRKLSLKTKVLSTYSSNTHRQHSSRFQSFDTTADFSMYSFKNKLRHKLLKGQQRNYFEQSWKRKLGLRHQRIQSRRDIKAEQKEILFFRETPESESFRKKCGLESFVRISPW